MQVCEALRQEISKVHEQRIEKVERKVSVKLIEKEPSKRVIRVKQMKGNFIEIIRRLTKYKQFLSVMRYIF